MTTADWLHEQLNPGGLASPVPLHRFRRKNLAKIFAKLGFTKGVEIGVADGRHALMLCQTIPGLHYTGVDPWRKYRENPRGGPQVQHDGNREKAAERLKGFHVDLMQERSMSAVHLFDDNSLDFVYIDGNHCFDFVMRDIVEWGKKVKIGGIISGHDYYPFQWAGVIEAVNAYTAAHHVAEWFVAVDEREPTWFFAKTPEAFPHRGW